MDYIGVDIGGTKCAVVAGNDNGTIRKKIKFPTPQDGNARDAVAKIVNVVKSLLSPCSTAIGVSCGGPLDSKAGIILSPPNLPGWDNVPITDILRSETHLPCYLQNDADAGALAEWKLGAGRGRNNIIFLTFGTGMGAGLILNGKLYCGRNNGAGEIGHIRLEPIGPVGYGKSGSFEGLCSGGGIAQLGKLAAMEQLQLGKPTLLCDSMKNIDGITALSIAQAAGRGDLCAIRVYETAGRYLGMGISMLMDILNPEAIIIGGIFPRSGELITVKMNEAIRTETLPSNLCPVVPSELGERIGDVAAICVAAYGVERSC